MPPDVRAAVEERLGSPIVRASSQSAGFSPGVAARLRTEDGRRLFAKAAGPEPSPAAPELHRAEARVTAALPAEAPVPRLHFSHDEGGWMVLIFEDIDGRNPAVPWRSEELDATLEALVALRELLTPSPLLAGRIVGGASDWPVISSDYWRKAAERRPVGLDRWSARHLEALADLEAGAPAAAVGSTLLHLDLRADNLLITPENRVLVVDWPHARVGASWVDTVFLAPSVAMQGGPPPEELLARDPHGRTVDPDALAAVVAAVAGFFILEGLQPTPAGLPTLRPFQSAQGEATRKWLARLTGWR